MRQLENVSEELAASYFSSKEVVSEKFSHGISGENPYWEDDQVVPSLSDLCIKTLVKCFSFKPGISRRLTGNERQRFLSQLSVTESIIPAYDWLEDGLYWKRRCLTQYPACDVAKHGGSWKRMCIEQTIRGHMEIFKPLESDMGDLKELVEALGKIVKTLELTQLISPTIMVAAGQALKGQRKSPSIPGSATSSRSTSRSSSPSGPNEPEEIDMTTPANHLDFSIVLPLFPNLEELILCFQVKKCGIDFRWNMFGLTEKDADNIAQGIASCPMLRKLSLRNSKVTDTLLYDVVGGLDKLSDISILDFPNNALTDECIDVLTKAMQNKKISVLNLSNNKICNEGAKNLAIFIANGKSCITDLNLSLNLMEDDGAITLLKAISLDKLITNLNMSSNRLTVDSCEAVRDLLKLNRVIHKIDLSCNQLTDPGGITILEGLKYNTSIRKLDIRLTGVGKKVDVAVQNSLHKNSGFKD